MRSSLVRRLSGRQSPVSRRALPAALAIASVVGSLLAAPVSAVDPTPEPTPMPIFIDVPSQPGPLPVLGIGGPLAPAMPVTFFGRGSGAGVGMSQWGARGRALAGQDAATILGHYYQSTTLAAISPDTLVRVLVVNAFVPTAARPARIYGRGGPWTVDGIATTFPADAMLVFSRVAGVWRVTVTDAGGQLLFSGAPGNDLRVRPADPATRIQVWFKPSVYDLYRGVIRLQGFSGSVRAIDEVGLDDYLKGAVPAEMPFQWPAEALKAQAIAARSYAARRLHPTWGTFDLYDDSRTQVYLGVRTEKASSTAAVTETAGQVLTAGGSIANTIYNPVAGGASESNQYAYMAPSGALIAAPVAYLQGSSDRAPDGTPYDAASSASSWHTATYTTESLSAILAGDPRTNVGLLTAIDLSKRGVSGRLYAVTLSGSLGTVTVSGDVFRIVFNKYKPAGDPVLRSNLIDLAPIP